MDQTLRWSRVWIQGNFVKWHEQRYRIMFPLNLCVSSERQNRDGNNTVLIFREGCKSCLGGSEKKKEHPFQNENNPKTSHRPSSFTLRMRPCKMSLCCLEQGQFSITLLVTPKAKSSCSQGQAALRQVPSKVPTTGLTAEAQEWFYPFEFGPKEALPLWGAKSIFATMSGQPQTRLSVSPPFPSPQGFLNENQHRQTALPGVGCWEKPLPSSNGCCPP